MLVSVLIGALDAMRDASPSTVLRTLNDLLLARQQSGFSTCICAVVSASGEIAIANAGHLAPYLNGQELCVDNGLPLGISAKADYAETHHLLKAGEELTFLSDGVPEARNARRELFGFDRTAAISTQSAEAIAAAASAFGQEDDITVLTLTFAPAPVEALGV
jgi:phosphoserine phosphatase RsbU/P